MFRHVVLLKWKPGTTPTDVARFTAGLAALPPQIPQIRAYSFGADLGINQGTADYALVADFASVEDYKTYSKHPAHLAFLREVSAPMLDSYQSVQFELK